MTPKEKAEELVNKFMDIKTNKMSDYSVIYLPTAKQCALIVVGEIYKTNLKFGSYKDSDWDKNYRMTYWIDVMQEIEKL